MKINTYITFFVFLMIVNITKINAIQNSSTSENFDPIDTLENQKFEVQLENHMDELTVFGALPGQEEVDGNVYPQNVDELVCKLRSTTPECIDMQYNQVTHKDEYFLKMRTQEEINTVFLALRKIYPNNIKCDTETYLFALQQTRNIISLQLIFDFLAARAKIATDQRVAAPTYFRCLGIFLNKIGPVVMNNKQLKLYEILPQVGDKAIIVVDKHMGIIERTSENKYSATGWGRNGVRQKTFNTIPILKHLIAHGMQWKFILM